MRLNIKRKIDKATTPDQLIEAILYDRGITDVENFLHPLHPETIKFNTFFADKKQFKKQFDTLIKTLEKIKKNNDMIIVYSDYDADGITGGAIVWETLHNLGFNVMPHVPDRKKEGYGFSKVGLDLVKEKHNPALIISVDHGISGATQITYAKSIGIPIVVTDHHQKSSTPPDDALAIFHTDALSGSGVAYFFAKELHKYFKKESFHHDYAALAAIGLIADLVPLTGHARGVARHGLIALSNSKRHGIVALLQSAGIADKSIGTYEVGFTIAPRINAFGRIGDATDALRLLCTTNAERAKVLAEKAGITNKKRQDLIDVAIKEAFKIVDETQKILFVHNPNWEEGIIGLIASKLVEKYKRPALAMTNAESGIKGSARSIKGFDITAFLRLFEKELLSVGGHPAAAGLLLSEKKLAKFVQSAQKKANKMITDEMLVPTLNIDMELPLSLATIALAELLEKLEPFGIGNPKPVFYSLGKIIDIKLLGKTKKHVKAMVKTDNSFPLEVMFFNMADDFVSITKGQEINFAYTLEVNRWNGSEKVNAMGKYLKY